MYITVTDSKGATLGINGPFASVSHRFEVQKLNFYGYESLRKLFNSDKELFSFLELCCTSETGSYFNGLTWEWK